MPGVIPLPLGIALPQPCTRISVTSCGCHVHRVTQSVQRLATAWTVRGSNPGGGQNFPHLSRPCPGAHPTSCTTDTGSFPGLKSGRGRDADPSPPSSAVVKKEQSYTSVLPMGRTACTEPQCLYKGDLNLYLYVCSVQYDVSLLFASLCYFLITRLMSCNILYIFVLLFSLFILCFVYLFPILFIL